MDTSEPYRYPCPLCRQWTDTNTMHLCSVASSEDPYTIHMRQRYNESAKTQEVTDGPS